MRKPMFWRKWNTNSKGTLHRVRFDIANKVKYLSTQANDNSLHYVHNEIGYNFKLPSLNAALGVAQISKINYFLKLKDSNNNIKTFTIIKK